MGFARVGLSQRRCEIHFAAGSMNRPFPQLVSSEFDRDRVVSGNDAQAGRCVAHEIPVNADFSTGWRGRKVEFGSGSRCRYSSGRSNSRWTLEFR